jgi:hypothetical protein
MRNKKWFVSKVYTLASFLAAFGFAGAANGGTLTGGGGQGLLCKNSRGKSVLTSLDTAEGTNAWGYSYPRSSSTIEKEIERVVHNYRYFAYRGNRADNDFRDDQETKEYLLKEFRAFEQSLVFTKKGVHLPLSEDLGKLLFEIPQKCKRVQVLYYPDQLAAGQKQAILADRAYWRALNPQEQLAFFLHEHVYENFRLLNQETNSQRTRKIVGLLLLDQEFPGTYRLLKDQTKGIYCRTPLDRNDIPLTEYFVLPKPNAADEVVFMFTYLRGEAMLAETSFDRVGTVDEYAERFVRRALPETPGAVWGSISEKVSSTLGTWLLHIQLGDGKVEVKTANGYVGSEDKISCAPLKSYFDWQKESYELSLPEHRPLLPWQNRQRH